MKANDGVIFTENTDGTLDKAKELFPSADLYMLELLAVKGFFDGLTRDKAVDLINYLKKELEITDEPFDDLLIEILLLRQSRQTAKHKVRVFKSALALKEISAALSLDKNYENMLLNYFGSLASAELFIDEDKASSLSKTVDRLIKKAEEQNKFALARKEGNKDYITALFKDKKISRFLYLDLINAYAVDGAVSFSSDFEKIFEELNSLNNNPSQNIILACKAMLFVIAKEEAVCCAHIAKAIKYPLLEDDLQTIALRYGKLKTPQETAEIFETVLRRLPYLDDPVENLGLAARVVADGNAETFKTAEIDAAQRKGKMLFMRKLSADKFFAGCEDELTKRFYGQNTAEEVASMFHHILHELPHAADIYENTDIALKVLLKKLPHNDAAAQAEFRKSNKVNSAAGALEQEALGSYLGVKSKEDVLLIFKEKLSPYSFWKEDEDKYCYALSIIVAELNGKVSPFSLDLSLKLLDAALPEQSVEIIASELCASGNFTPEDIISAYRKFHSVSSDHIDAARRTVNMLQ